MSADLTGRVCLVTGGGSGIGASSARALARAGATVVLASRDRERLDRIAAEIADTGGRADVLPCDLTGESAAGLVDEAARRHGRLDVLVHAAGNQIRKPTAEFTLADWDAVMEVHLRAGFVLAQAAVRHMVPRGSGALVFVGSMTSERLGHPSTVAYAAAKSGLLGLARTLAAEYAADGVRVNTVLPGFIATDMAAQVTETPQKMVFNALYYGPARPLSAARFATFGA